MQIVSVEAFKQYCIVAVTFVGDFIALIYSKHHHFSSKIAFKTLPHITY